MKNLFISIPMNGKTRQEILEEREAAVKEAETLYADDSIHVLDTVFEDYNPAVSPLIYLARAIASMAGADLFYSGSGWEDARGCKIERQIAESYGIEILKDVSA